MHLKTIAMCYLCTYTLYVHEAMCERGGTITKSSVVIVYGITNLKDVLLLYFRLSKKSTYLLKTLRHCLLQTPKGLEPVVWHVSISNVFTVRTQPQSHRAQHKLSTLALRSSIQSRFLGNLCSNFLTGPVTL